MDGFQIRELIVVRVDAHAEEETGVTAVNNLVVAELLSERLSTGSPRRSLTGTFGHAGRSSGGLHRGGAPEVNILHTGRGI